MEPDGRPKEEFLTQSAVCDLLQISLPTLYAIRERIGYVRLAPRVIRFKRADVDRYIEERCLNSSNMASTGARIPPIGGSESRTKPLLESANDSSVVATVPIEPKPLPTATKSKSSYGQHTPQAAVEAHLARQKVKLH